jgi:hypothetical protein
VTPSGKGQFEKHATVTTNDPKQGSFELIIKFQTSVLKGYRVGSFLFDPKDEINATVKQGEVFTSKIEIINDSDEVVKVEKLDSDRNILDFEIETIEPGKRYALIIKSRKDLEVGAHAQLIRLKTSNSAQAMLEIAIGLTVEAK